MSAVPFHDGDERDRRPLARWGGSLLLVLGAHAAVGIGAMSWRVAMDEAAAPPPAVMLDLAPLPEVAPPPPTVEPVIPEPEPPPEPVIEPPEPEPVVEPEPIPEVKPEPPPPVPAEVSLPEPPKPKPKPKETPKPQPPKVTPPKPQAQVKPAPTPPQATTAQAAPSAPAAASSPSPAPAVARNSTAVPTWQGLVLGHLERHKRYPRSAQLRRQQGVPQVRIVIDRSGKVLSARLEKSSGVESLDEETVALAERASPLPAPPPEMAQDRIELVVPVQFVMR